MPSASPRETHAERTLLRFDACRLPLADVEGDTAVVDAELRAGELVLLHADEDHERALNAAICGLLRPISGTLHFDGRDWHDLPADLANALRGRIGTAFGRDRWIPYLSVLDNVILAQRHHRRVSVDEASLVATRWALRFGLPGIPVDRPDEVDAYDRRRANLVRAFAGDPAVIVIEHQGDDVPAKLRTALVNAIRDARDRGALVLWYSRDLTFVLNDRIPASRRLQFGGGGLRTLEAAA